MASWPGSVQLVSGRPRHPQSQGLVEQSHYTLERMLNQLQNVDPRLPHIVCKLEQYVNINS